MPNTGRTAAAGRGERYGGSRGNGVGVAVSWSQVDPQILWDVIAAVTACGDLCSFSCTLDGGALHFRILSAGNSYPYYWATAAAAQDALRIVLDEAQRT